MRIIAGEFRRRLLHTPKDASTTRPIPDRVKESLFGLLRGHCEGATVFDGFAGTGAIGLEAVSRGASSCLFVERDRSIAQLLSRNVDELGARDRCEVFQGDALGGGALARSPRPLTLAFLDPPYPLTRDPLGFRRIMAQLGSLVDLLADDGIAVLRTPWPLWLVKPAGPAREPRHEDEGRRQRRGSRRAGADEFSSRPSRPDGRPPRRVDPAGLDEGEDESPAPPPEERLPADLSLPNAAGPETHVYHAMALHLYMRRR